MKFTSPTGNPTFFRTYSRRKSEGRESFVEVVQRSTNGLAKLGKFTQKESQLVQRMMEETKVFPSGRWMWVGGTPWIEKPENFYSAYNCNSTNIDALETFALMMALGMMGCGTGAVLQEKFISKLPPVRNQLSVRVVGKPGQHPVRLEKTTIEAFQINGVDEVELVVGDSRQGWVSSMQILLDLAFRDWSQPKNILVTVDLSSVRPDGSPIKGFGGVANPVQLSRMYERLAIVLNRYTGRQLDAEGVCLLLDEVAVTIVAGNVRRYAGIRQFDSNARLLKQDLWQQDEHGNWKIDPERDALRMSNHTRVYTTKPSLETCVQAVRDQYYSGEGAIQWAGESLARANADLLDTEEKRKEFLAYYSESSPNEAEAILEKYAVDKGLHLTEQDLNHRMSRIGMNPCAEVLGSDFMCNLAEIHINQIDPLDLEAQKLAFVAGGLSVAALLHHQFVDERYRVSRELDPIVGVSITGLFDFFVNAFGTDWLRWWSAGRPDKWYIPAIEYKRHDKILALLGVDQDDPIYNDENDFNEGLVYRELEKRYLQLWKEAAYTSVWNYCDAHNLKRPNRCTVVQPGGTKSLLTGASAGWHPPKAQRYIRRITFTAYDPVAMACKDYGYSVVPSQSCKDENGNLLNDPYDPRVNEWLVEIPVEVPWANLEGADQIDISQFSAKAQFDFWMQVQKYYTGHNCFSQDTEFLTSEGVQTFEHFASGESVTVLNANGAWVSAQVVTTNEPRTMYEIVLQQGKTKRIKTIKATGCHRFPVRRISGGASKPSIKTTLELKPGHRFVTNTSDLFELDPEGIVHGMVLGDGSRYRNNKTREYQGAQLYLCGEKRELVKYVEGFGKITDRNDLDQTRIYGLKKEYKELPSDNISQEYFAGLLAGLFATDGNICHSTFSLSTSEPEMVDFICHHAPRLGISVTSTKWYDSSGYENARPGCQIVFSKETFGENLVLRSFHQDHLDNFESQPCQWRVVSVTELPEKEYGWCVMEPETNHFTLTQNILVMNTSATIELRENEIEELGGLIHEAILNDHGYVSCALLARFDAKETFPRLPFEPVSKEQYDQLQQQVLERRESEDFQMLLERYDTGWNKDQGVTGCDSDKCLIMK